MFRYIKSTIKLTGSTTICEGGSVDLTSDAATSYSWSNGVTTQKNTIAKSAGNYSYTVTIKDANGCSATSAAITVIVDNCSGIDELSLSQQMSIYPNPSNGIFTLIMNNEQGIKNIEVKVMNVLGQVVYQSAITAPQSEINLKEVPSGIYFLQLQTAEGAVYRKLLKE